MNDAKARSFYQLFEPIPDGEGIHEIVIPKIQRDYAQGRKNNPDIKRVRERFLKALKNGITGKEPLFLDFIYGSIADGNLTLLDGQQRLTTLYLLHWYSAKKENIPEEQYAFLKRFSYATRPSSSDFCKHLIDFCPVFDDGLISEQIENQPWFPYDWENDPTVASMMTMIDKIHSLFADVDGIWKALVQEGKIRFYFLSLDENGLTDEIYIKMNSRGKPLTAFEHFKAELDQKISAYDKNLAREIERKIDIEWTDFLWKYVDKSETGVGLVDPLFLNFFKFACDIIELKDGGSPTKRGYDEFELIRLYFDSSNPDIPFKRNILFIRDALDALRLFAEDLPNELFGEFLSTDSCDCKARLDYRSTDLLRDCLENYYNPKKAERAFTFKKVFLLYAFVLYCENKQTVSSDEFRERIRIINNLTSNSEEEMNDRSTNSRLPGIVAQTESIILSGEVRNETGVNGYNAFQIEEEASKAQWRREHPELVRSLNLLENHDLLNGQISIIGLDNYDVFDRFAELFSCDRDLVACALLTVCDYSRVENRWRHTLGTRSGVGKCWEFLFHNSRASGEGETSRALVGLLRSLAVISNDSLQAKCEEYLSDCESRFAFDWRYYFIKYPVFRPDSYGKYEVINESYYTMRALRTKVIVSPNTYSPFLKAIDVSGNHLDSKRNGERLIHGSRFIYCVANGFELRDTDGITVIDQRYVDQVEGIDRENRIEAYLANPFE